MNIKILYLILIIFSFFICCNDEHAHEKEHDEELSQNEEQHTGSGHEEHEEGEAISLVAYSAHFELFAETEPFIQGEESHMLAHLTVLPGFKALKIGKLTLMIVDGDEIQQKITDVPVQNGLCHINITPQNAGTFAFRFLINNNEAVHEILVPDVSVFKNEHEAHENEEEHETHIQNTTVFTKEQSWKANFETAYPENKTMGEVINAVGRIETAQGKEQIITAKTKGVVLFTHTAFLPGKEVWLGQHLLTISGSNFADNNITVRYAEAKNDYDYAKSEFQRAKKLSDEKIISEKEFLKVKSDYEKAQSRFQNLRDNFNLNGQHVASPMKGFIKNVYVKNGEFVEEGQVIAVVSQNNKLFVTLDVPQKYIPELPFIATANFKTLWDSRIYTLEELNGSVLSYGKAVNNSNYLVPVALQIDNPGSFIQGSFVEVFLKTKLAGSMITIPNSALLEEQGIYFVYVQVTPESFEKREVNIGASDGLRTAVISGLNENERVVTKGGVLIKLSQATGALDAHSGHVH